MEAMRHSLSKTPPAHLGKQAFSSFTKGLRFLWLGNLLKHSAHKRWPWFYPRVFFYVFFFFFFPTQPSDTAWPTSRNQAERIFVGSLYITLLSVYSLCWALGLILNMGKPQFLLSWCSFTGERSAVHLKCDVNCCHGPNHVPPDSHVKVLPPDPGNMM